MLGDLQGHEVLFGGFGRASALESLVGVLPRGKGRLRTNDEEVVHQAALAGVGLALLPWFLVQGDVAAGRLTVVLAEEVDLRGPVAAVYPAGR